MVREDSFIDNVLKAFKNIIKEIEKGSSEHDVRYKFAKYFVEEVLGYESKHFKLEEKRADLTIIDENNFSVIKIETKRPTEKIDKPKHEEQAFKYEEETTRFIGLTNFLQFRLWEPKKTGNELRIDLDFSKILEQKKTVENLSSEEKSQILFLNNLTKECLFDKSKYEKFNETYARIDITKEAGFKKLLDRLDFIANNLLFGYTLKAFGEYREGYNKYQNELKGLSEVPKDEKNGYSLAKYKQKIEDEYSKYKTFGGYYLWKEYSGKGQTSDNDVMSVFCKESIYVLLNKLLFIRICEDKKLLEKNISNGGIEELRLMLKKRFEEGIINRELLEIAFKSARTLYAHFYETGILDWFRTGDGELNELLNRVLWILNQFDFAHVDRDILGNLYEKYLPSRERKKLGEFYTPTEIIDYILTSVGYTYSYDIETKDLLDPACGSGGFLVRASRRLISRYLMKFRKTDKRELRSPKNWKEIISKLSADEAKIILEDIQEHIYGLDINPFACHIAEMNMLFQVIDLYQKTKEKYSDYTLKRFKIYQTDSLELPKQKTINDFGNHLRFLQERDEINSIKNQKFDFIVGNPPYVRVQMLDETTKENLIKNYESAVGNFDLYVIFIERGFKLLKQKGRLGYITSNKFTQSSYGQGIRKFVTQNCTINRIIDFGDSGIFNDVTNYPLIFIGTNEVKNNNQIAFIKVLGSKERIIDEIWRVFNKKYYKSEYLEVFKIEQKELNENSWLFSNPVILKLTKKIEKSTNGFFIKNFARPHRCLYTGLNEAFIINEITVKKERLEKELIRKVIGGRDIQRWKINWKNKFIIYPYNEVKGQLRAVILNKYPNIKRHLEQFKDKLMARWFIKKIRKNERESRWFEYADPRNVQQFESTKIITPDISLNSRFALDFDKIYSLNTSYVIDLNDFKQDPRYLLGMLNSSTLEFFLKKISPFISGGYYRYINQYLEKLPIKLPETAEEKKIADQITKKVDEILEINKSGIMDIDSVLESEETEKLHSLPKAAFSISNDAKFNKVKTEASKIYINSQDFIEIKDKKVRDFVEVYLNSKKDELVKSKDIKNIILNISVPKSDELLKDIIKKGGKDQFQIKDKVKKMEEKINELVYKIYKITKEERKIVEENL